MLLKIKSLVRNTLVYDWYNCLRHRFEWLYCRAMRPEYSPHLLKRKLLAKRASDFKLGLFVETGTFFGDMISAQHKRFKELISIELDDYLFERASKRFKNHENIKILHGDSGHKISEVLENMDGPCLFWLDAHYSGGITAHGDLMTPVFAEINHILTHHEQGHVIVIDDARLFNGTDGYPTLCELQKFVSSIDQNCSTWIENDTISIARAH